MYDRLIVGTSEDVEAFSLITQILSSVTTYHYTSESFFMYISETIPFLLAGLQLPAGAKDFIYSPKCPD